MLYLFEDSADRVGVENNQRACSVYLSPTGSKSVGYWRYAETESSIWYSLLSANCFFFSVVRIVELYLSIHFSVIRFFLVC